LTAIDAWIGFGDPKEAGAMLPLERATLELLSAETPEWVTARRVQGFEQFDNLEMPLSTEEVWRYVDLDFDVADFAVAHQSGDPMAADKQVDAALGRVPGHAVVVDGRPVEVTSDAVDGVVFESIMTAATARDSALRGVYGSGVDPALDKFSAAHHAFGGDGVFLFVPKGTNVSEPFVVDVQAVAPDVSSYPRVSIVVEGGSDAGVLIHYRSPAAGRRLVVPQIEAFVGDDARLRVTALQEWGRETIAVAQLRMVAGRDSSLGLGEVGLGGALARLHLTIDLEGTGSNGRVDGLYFGDGNQVLDYRAFMNHSAPNTTSDMFLKGAVEDEADSVFTGLIRIEKEAQKTNAFQTNRNLVLSEGAEAQSVPNLEILANDVRCGHGSTVGPLDLDQRYYLMSRGLDQERADRLQVRGFFEEAIRRLPEPALAGPVRERVNAKYIAAQEEGRV